MARNIVRPYDEQSEKESDREKDLGEELANVLFVALRHHSSLVPTRKEPFPNKPPQNQSKHDRAKDNKVCL